MKASSVWRSAPAHVRITVECLRLPQSDQGAGIASFCRSSFSRDKAYILTISDEQAWIYSWGKGSEFWLTAHPAGSEFHQ